MPRQVEEFSFELNCLKLFQKEFILQNDAWKNLSLEWEVERKLGLTNLEKNVNVNTYYYLYFN